MLLEILKQLIQNILSAVNAMGYLGIFIGMIIESSFFPLPSELILIPAGFLISSGEMNFFIVLALASIGSVIGASINYFIAFFLGRKTIDLLISKYGKFLFINQKSLRKADDYFEKHGEITTFLGRLVFVVRHLISLPAGFSRMNFTKFLIFTFLGSALWSLILILVGMFLGNSNVDFLMKIIAAFIFLICLLIFLIYHLMKKTKKKTINKTKKN